MSFNDGNAATFSTSLDLRIERVLAAGAEYNRQHRSHHASLHIRSEGRHRYFAAWSDGDRTRIVAEAQSLTWAVFQLTKKLEEMNDEPEDCADDEPPPPECSICRRRHGREITHACE